MYLTPTVHTGFFVNERIEGDSSGNAVLSESFCDRTLNFSDSPERRHKATTLTVVAFVLCRAAQETVRLFFLLFGRLHYKTFDFLFQKCAGNQRKLSCICCTQLINVQSVEPDSVQTVHILANGIQVNQPKILL